MIEEEPPAWMRPLLSRVARARGSDFSAFRPPPEGGRPSAVLVLFAETEAAGPDVLLLQRAADMRNHAGQPAFPGGAADPGDQDPAATALREAKEEVGLQPSSVAVQALLPQLWIPVSNFVVTPVLAWWQAPHPVVVMEPREVASVTRVPVAELVDPANRVRVRHSSGWIGPGFRVKNMLVWGFTAGVLTVLLEMGGWSQPIDRDGPIEDLTGL